METILGISQVLWVMIVLAVPDYVRDVLNLPLFGDRILYLNLYIVLLALVLCMLQAYRDRDFPVSTPATRVHSSNAVLWGVVFFALLFFAATFFHGATSFFVPLQASIFAISLAVLAVLVRHGRLPALLTKLNVALWCIITVQCLVVAAGYFVPLSLELSAPRNLLPYAAVLVYALALAVGNKGARRAALIQALALIAINGTRGAMILLPLVVVAHWIRTLASSYSWIRTSFSVGLMVGLIGTHIAAYYYGLRYLLINSLPQLQQLGTIYRTGVDNQAASSISRIFSVPYTLMIVVDHNALGGLGAARAATITFWGYPVHNLFVSYIAVFGLLGLVFSLAYLAVCFSIARWSLGLFAIAFFIPWVANDFYPLLALCLLPILKPALFTLRHKQRLPSAAASPY